MDDETIVRLLTRAVGVVKDAGIPDDLREAAYITVLRLLIPAEPDPAASPVKHPSGSGTGTPGDDLIGKIGTGLGLDGRQAGNLFAEKDGAPELILKASKLPQAKAAAAHDIALLVMASRQLGGLDDYTDPEVLRDAVRRYGRFDTGNFGKHMKSLDNYIITSGKGKAAKRKLTQPGLEAAADLARGYLEES